MDFKSIDFSPFIIGTMRLGKWGEKFSTAKWQTYINQCLELGINDFDHADIYGDYTTEYDFGKAIKGNTSLRESIKLTTKCGIRMPAINRPENHIKSYDSSASYIKKSVEKSLQNLQTDYIDLLLLHRPDFLIEPNEVAKAIQELKQEGKVKSFGVSNFSVSQFEMLNSFIQLENHQIEASIFHLTPFENGQLDQLIGKNVIPTVWSPLGGGLKDLQNNNKNLTSSIDTLCKKYNINTGQLLLAWLLKHPAQLVPVLGTSKISRIKEAIEIKNLSIDSEDWYALYSASKGEIIP